MGNLRRWSTTATGNATVAGGVNTINFAEGQTPGSVNNSAREMMAQVRGIYTPSDWGWVENSATVSVASQTTFKLAGNQTSDWVAPRRWRLKSGSTTRYGSVVSSSFTSETTITVTVDSGSLSASHSLAALSVIDGNHVPTAYVTSASIATSLALYATLGGTNTFSATQAFSGGFTVVSAGNGLVTGSGGLGYGTGSGGTVTQLTSKSTGVTLNKTNGQITMASNALAANAYIAFTLTNSTIAATDIVHIIPASGTVSAYWVRIAAISSGSCTIGVQNVSAGSLSEALVINFAVTKAVTS